MSDILLNLIKILIYFEGKRNIQYPNNEVDAKISIDYAKICFEK
jgi:hypothetical protein